MKLRDYYELTKPGIIYGNMLPTIGAFFLAAHMRPVTVPLFFGAVGGLALVIASICVFNNYIDRGIDRKMERTKHRALAAGRISGRAALIYGAVLGIAGVAVLWHWTNPTTVFVALLGSFFYVVLYSWAKRKSVHGTLVGAIAGATPPAVGYCAVTGNFDTGALLLVLILCFWQMPHFYAIGIYRAEEYKEAGIPILPLKKGLFATKIQMFLYVIAFVAAATFLGTEGYAGCTYVGITGIAGILWLWLCSKGFKVHGTEANEHWARRMFLFSLVVLTVFSVMIAVG